MDQKEFQELVELLIINGVSKEDAIKQLRTTILNKENNNGY